MKGDVIEETHIVAEGERPSQEVLIKLLLFSRHR